MIFESFYDNGSNNGSDDILSLDETATLNQELRNPNALFEAFLIDDISRMSDEEKEQFIQSEAAEFLVTEGMISKRNIMKLTKESDLDRRIKVAALQIAKDKGDNLYDKAIAYRAKSKEAIASIVKKYGSQASRTAKVAQKAYIRKNPITMKVTATPEKISKTALFGDVDRKATQQG